MSLAILFQEITQTYRKFGWTLRRISLTAAARGELGEALSLIDKSVELEESDVNALWFSRIAAETRETWEVRLLSHSPFALLETFALNAVPSERAKIIRAMLEKLRTNSRKIKI